MAAVTDFVLQFLRDLGIALVIGGVPILGRRWVTHQGRLSFLGIGLHPHQLWKSTSVRIFLSSIVVRSDLSVAPTTACVSIHRGFSGLAITESEYGIAVEFARRIDATALPLGREQSEPPWLRPFGHIVCPIEPAPAPGWAPPPPATNPVGPESRRPVRVYFNRDRGLQERVRGHFDVPGTVLAIGSPIYNAMTAYVLEHCNSEFQFIKETRKQPNDDRYYIRGVRVRDPHGVQLRSCDFMRPDDHHSSLSHEDDESAHDEYFVVEKFTDPAGRHGTIFVCAGLGTAATAAAVRFLANWGPLARHFGNHDFAVLRSLRIETAEERDTARDLSLDNTEGIWAYDKVARTPVTLS